MKITKYLVEYLKHTRKIMVYDLVRDDYAAFNLSEHYVCLILAHKSLDTLSKIFPVNIKNLGYGSAKDFPLLSEKLRITALLTIVMLEDTILLLTPKCCYSDCKKILHEFLGENCFLDELVRVYLIEGPGAASEVGAMINEDVRFLQYYDSVQFSFAHHNQAENVCLRCSFFGEVGFLLFMINENAEAEKRCMTNLNFQSFDDDDIDTLVNEANSKVFNKSVFRHDCPIEIGLSHILDFEDDEFYFHQELNEAKKRNKRRIVAIQCEKNPSENSGDLGCIGSLSSVDGSEVGILLRTFYSKTMNRVIGYALVDRDKSYLGSKLSNNLYETIEVHKTPFFVTKSNFLTA